jgi:hypothetical protein
MSSLFKIILLGMLKNMQQLSVTICHVPENIVVVRRRGFGSGRPYSRLTQSSQGLINFISIQQMHYTFFQCFLAPTYVSAYIVPSSGGGSLRVHNLKNIQMSFTTHNYRIKFVNAQQAKLINCYKNIKEKLHKTNASIWFKKICKIEKLTPKYIHIIVNGYFINFHYSYTYKLSLLY